MFLLSASLLRTFSLFFFCPLSEVRNFPRDGSDLYAKGQYILSAILESISIYAAVLLKLFHAPIYIVKSKFVHSDSVQMEPNGPIIVTNP